MRRLIDTWSVIAMTKYQQAKNKIRDLAADWQSDFENNNYSWLELLQWQEFLVQRQNDMDW